ncbi:hypothetical protein FHR75_004158 [Kineococcus radiotolerans]|uniref:Uncharacterized protein n=1 Tax=Kineococcus radiotolerans TaxID=131568 RepID=A0A7W4XYM4_KINRA|nr:hypothetical protein [Kineococcus radiotolerans]MBB2903316.1 hypothetical protein [Kineococcus radiotolerans]
MADSVREPDFADVVAVDLASGVHRNPTGRPRGFSTAWFHRPEELHAEVAATGLHVEGPVAVEGIARLAPRPRHPPSGSTRARVLDLVRATESGPTLLGASGHLLVVGRTTR